MQKPNQIRHREMGKTTFATGRVKGNIELNPQTLTGHHRYQGAKGRRY